MNILINGATRGIGLETALYLSGNKDNHIIVTGRDEDALDRISSSGANNNITPITLDLSLLDNQAESFREQVYSKFSILDVLINNAGMLVNREFIRFSSADARQIMEVNFLGPAALIRILRPLMARGTHIVNIASMGGFQGSSKYPGLSYYSCSKAALACLSECLAEEFRPDGIVVNCLALGSVQTEMFEEAFPGLRAPVEAGQMGVFVGDFAVNGGRYFNGKILPVAFNNP